MFPVKLERLHFCVAVAVKKQHAVFHFYFSLSLLKYIQCEYPGEFSFLAEAVEIPVERSMFHDKNFLLLIEASN